MGKSNKGKKYTRLTGFEIPTADNLARAAAFLDWYAINSKDLERRVRKNRRHLNSYDPDIMADAMLQIYDAIALKGADVKDFTFYFYRTYYNIYLAAIGKARTVCIDDAAELEAPNFDYNNYELAVDHLKSEILEYVRGKYDPVAVSLFEIYIGLQPDTSYKRIAALLGIPFSTVWTSIGVIRKDVAAAFGNRKEYLLSIS